jgi:predicted nucleotidyltransferase
MSGWIPRWLAGSYVSLLKLFGAEAFSSDDARRAGVARPQIVLPRLERAGWLHRLGRGRYVAADPLVAVVGSFGDDWRGRIRQGEFVPLLEQILARLVSGYGRRLKGVVLFGSVARGSAGMTSDIDLIVLASEMPSKYDGRVGEALDIIHGAPARARWAPPGSWHQPELILLDAAEVGEPYPFFLDVVEEGVVLYDVGGFTENLLSSLREKFKASGAARTRLQDGSWYWSLERAPVP